MKSFLVAIALLFAVPAVAAERDCYTKTVVICPTHKPKHKKKPPIVVVPAPLVEYREKLVVVHRDCTPAIIYRDRLVPAGCPPEGNAVFSAWGALGLGARDPYVSGNFGGQVRFPKAFLGLRVYSALQYGFGANALLYVYQGPRVRLHIIDPGVFLPIGDSYLSDADIKRHVDITVGAGVEVKLACHLALTADLRTNIPDPGVIAAHESCGAGCRSHIDAGNAVGNAFGATQLLLGALFSF